MSLRARASAIVLTAAAACTLLTPAALASSHGPVQVTGKQLMSALLPASDFVAGYSVVNEEDSGGSLEHGQLFSVPSMSCKAFWIEIGIVRGFGETAFASDLVGTKSVSASVLEVFGQSVYQFPSTHAASSYFGQLNTKYQSCRSLSVSDTKGGTLHWTVRSVSKQHVGGHQALQLVENESDSAVPGPPLTIDVLWTMDGTDVYMISTTLLTTTSSKPTQSSLTLKLIARVGALR
jgi:PknH-like extracellular domain